MFRYLVQCLLGAYCSLNLLGCAFSSKMDFASTSFKVPGSSKAVAVAVIDQRPYVLSGDKTPEWVGLLRSGAGIPYGVHTSSGKPLANDFSSALAKNFSQAGAQALQVSLPKPTTGRAEALLAAKGADADKILLLTLNEWKSDTYTDVDVYYNLEAEVLNRAGTVLAKETLQGKEEVEGSMWNPIGASERAMVAKQREKLEALLNRPSIQKGLSQ